MSESTQAQTRYVRYVFVDIVRYSRDRSVEAQTEIVDKLNSIILGTLESLGEPERIFLPTGDGVCIAITDPLAAFDIHLQLALQLLSSLSRHNSSTPDRMRQFDLRIGLNENVDNLITDVNGSPNIAGPGINTAQRVMNLGDDGCVLVSEATHETLRHRERYMNCFTRYEAVVKHDVKLVVYQYTRNAHGVRTDKPMGLLDEEDPIEAELRSCLEKNLSTTGSVRCFRAASAKLRERYQGVIADAELLINNPEERKAFSEARRFGEQAFELLTKFRGQIYHTTAGTMYRVMAADDEYRMLKGLVEEAESLMSLVRERDGNPKFIPPAAQEHAGEVASVRDSVAEAGSDKQNS